MKSENMYQSALIVFGVIATVLFALFFMREIYPEYKLYQNAYMALEEFRSTYTGKPAPEFKEGVKQILLLSKNFGPERIDRCISCHVALQYDHFSPTKIVKDKEGKPRFDQQGKAILERNEDYVWAKLEEKIADLRDPKKSEELKKGGKEDQLQANYAQAEHLEHLKSVKVDGYVYDMTKVLRAHPMIGNEIRPFQFHDMNEYGCTSCHSGNGRGLTTDKAHGAIYDGHYDEASTGPAPQFLEVDSENDPPFSKVFNHKPGEKLLFQTTPLLVGNLIQSSCAQCHRADPIAASLEEEKSLAYQHNSIPYYLLKNYEEGKYLYFSQACYACHRISDLARGGVGPELTEIGKSPPWYIKESVVWPQADLPTSTMPNMVIDHPELEDLTTFMLAQRNDQEILSVMQRKTSIKHWEEGAKKPWEEPLKPLELRDLDHAMMIYATEGCAACHRLQGFSSSVGFASENNQNQQNILEDRLWFRKLFPEEIPGSEIIAHIEKLGPELNKKIVDGVRKDQILEKIEKQNPKALESFYSNFAFALRAKNHHYAALAEKDPQHRDEYVKQRLAWQEQVRRVMKMFIQEYGLGRQIGPRLSWSGVFRSNQWLMEHFWNPGGHVPRSIMPVFSFDDSKFLSLSYMLEQLGKRNAKNIQQIWQLEGFSPALSYEMQCAQCHGNYRQGNGPVAVWIYPLPKNLHNATFLHNLTREQAIESITHGVKGTPMPPWGEVAIKGDHPVMSEEQIQQMTDWLFQIIPKAGSEDQDVIEKWKYSPEDVLKELRHEGGNLKGAFNFSSKNSSYLASTEKKPTDSNVGDVFDIKADPVLGPKKKAYYIKHTYYTPENIESGKELFLFNCAVCHGNEADGSGMRAGYMQEAKPRMLTNLDWLHTRDDMRLLRSIKFGVPGTAMTPWGDMTTTLQRLQLVIFIRSLSENKDQQDALKNGLYQSFDDAKWQIEKFRSLEYQTKKEGDGKLNQIQNLLDQENKLYLNIGNDLISALDYGESYRLYLQIVAFNHDRFTIEGNKLKMNEDPGKKVAELIDKIKVDVSRRLQEAEKTLEAAEAKLPSHQKQKALQSLQQEIKSYHDLNKKLDSLVKETAKMREQQKKLVQEYGEEQHGNQ